MLAPLLVVTPMDLIPENLPAKRPRGRPRKDITKRVNAAPPVEIDWTKDPADLILPCSDAEQAKWLSSPELYWTPADVRGMNRTYGFYEKLPMICRGAACFWAGQCPTRETTPAYMFEGHRCPIEIMELFRNFCRYVKELGVHPDDHVDLNYIHDLVRIDLQLKHIDMRLQTSGLEVEHVAAVAQKTGDAYYEKIAHPLLAVQAKLRNDRGVIYKALLASRSDKKKVEQQEGKQKLDILAALTRLRENVGGGEAEVMADAIDAVVHGDEEELYPEGSPYPALPDAELTDQLVDEDDEE